MMYSKLKDARKMLYRQMLFLMLGVTHILAAADFHIPTKWYTFLDSIQTSSNVLHDRIATIDDEVERDFRHREEMLERRLGRKKFYSTDEIEQLQDKIEDIRV